MSLHSKQSCLRIICTFFNSFVLIDLAFITSTLWGIHFSEWQGFLQDLYRIQGLCHLIIIKAIKGFTLYFTKRHRSSGLNAKQSDWREIECKFQCILRTFGWSFYSVCNSFVFLLVCFLPHIEWNVLTVSKSPSVSLALLTFEQAVQVSHTTSSTHGEN